MEMERSSSLPDVNKSSPVDLKESFFSFGWCTDSEIRLLKKLLIHKPIGVAKHFQMACLVDYMNNIYEDEDTDFEDILNPVDLHELNVRKNICGKPRVFKPKYVIRPTARMIWEKLDAFYDLKEVEKNESSLEDLTEKWDFSLPPDEFGDLLRKKEEMSKRTPQSSHSSTRRRATFFWYFYILIYTICKP
ncbi:unnamed protein product [Thelazia callipaeda]|uniref:Anaphase-promoting complex subunit 13 n=1 Tax=Thelazia callipaeda TaxID=103827 RepID=A0A0N5CZ73_THECL|nr:unnamed protein product [Thelazia callipaeda]